MANIVSTVKMIFSRSGDIDIVTFDGIHKLVRCSNASMMRCIGVKYSVRLINGRLSAMDTSDKEEGLLDFHTSSVTEVSHDQVSLVIKTKNSIYEFVREA